MKTNFLGLFVILFSPVILFSCGGKNTQQQNPASIPVPVNIVEVKTANVTGMDSYPGRVVPVNEVELRPQVGGYITNIYVKDGEKVVKGQKLYEIDRTKYFAAYQQATANLQSAKANLQRVSKDAERYQTLSEKDAIAKQRVDYAVADLQTAKAQLAAAEAAVSSAATDLSYSVIKAPFSGRIGISQVRVGSQVSPGQPLLNTISSDGPVAVDFVINEKEIPRFIRLSEGKHPDSLFTIGFSDGTKYELPGKLVAIDRAVGRQTGTITVRLNFPNPKVMLVPGMSVTVNVLNQDIGEQLLIPYKAVIEQMGEYFVYTVQGDSALQKRVELGTRVSPDVVIRGGLQEGEKIVVEGTGKLRNGAKVQVEAPKTAEQPTANN